MERFIKRSRLAACAVFMAALLVIYSFTLYKLQVVDGDDIVQSSLGTTSVKRTVSAARGSIYDTNGTLLVSDRTVYNISISRSLLLKQDNPNEVIRTLLSAAAEYGVEYNDEFPVTKTAPFEYDAGATKSQLSFLNSYFDYFKDLNSDMTAEELVSWMRDHYGISYTVAAEEARKIIGIRYGLELRLIVNTNDYVFAEDVPVEFVNYISERSFNCVTVDVESKRQYHTQYAAHILGYVAAVDKDEYQNKYKELGYPLDAIVGKTGVEYAFEEYLHGTDGKVTTYYDEEGAVTDVVVDKEAVAGCDVYLTIDINFQEQVEKCLAAGIAQINADRQATAEKEALESGEEVQPIEKAESGAVVVTNVKTGEILAMASYPTYDLATRGQNWSSISSDPLKPLWNRATNGIYNPGSTFKMVTALAALREGIITRNTKIEDKGEYTAYASLGYKPRCWIYPGSHGYLDVVGAIENSCNYFFYSVSDQMDIDQIAAVAAEFGFGSPTGVEIGEASGHLATREYKIQATGETGWWKADTLITSIGQGLNEFTPIQIANYAAAIANGGTLYSTTLLRKITSFDYAEILVENTPEILHQIDDPEGYISILQEGMRAVASTGTARSIFANYPIPVAAKTGTVQSGSTDINDGVFICYAPADDPEIAIAVVVEKGGSGSALAPIGRNLLDAYFTTQEQSSEAFFDNTLLK